ncbi:hypothetical protein QL285_003602 [Trifolium repens]|nr:hypothetical protein QL285_003602 [Trifolium repens]
MYTSSVQARCGESPAHHGEIIGSDLNQLAMASRSSLRRVSSAQNPARHEYSLTTRYGEFIQKLPCFVRNHNFQRNTYNSHLSQCSHNNLHNIKQNGGEFGI